MPGMDRNRSQCLIAALSEFRLLSAHPPAFPEKSISAALRRLEIDQIFPLPPSFPFAGQIERSRSPFHSGWPDFPAERPRAPDSIRGMNREKRRILRLGE